MARRERQKVKIMINGRQQDVISAEVDPDNEEDMREIGLRWLRGDRRAEDTEGVTVGAGSGWGYREVEV